MPKKELDVTVEKKRTKVTKKLLGQLLNLLKTKSWFHCSTTDPILGVTKDKWKSKAAIIEFYGYIG